MTAEPSYCSKHLKHVNGFTVRLTSYEIRITSDCTNKCIVKIHVLLANIAIITTCYTACSSVYLF